MSDVAVPHREVARQQLGGHSRVSYQPRALHSSGLWALGPEGGVVTVSGLDNGSWPNRAKTLLRATHLHHGASRV
jgi:hypothetical protein